jgi:polar amino acid transport system ATP-binding protein
MSAPSRDENILEVQGLTKRYGTREVLRGVDLKVTRADVFAIIGPNSCGKSTLLRCLNLLESYQEGRVLLRGQEASVGRPDDYRPGGEERARARRVRQKIGMVFQQFNLFPHLSVIQNVMLAPQKVLGLSKSEAAAVAEQMLRKVNLLDKAPDDPSSLSGGQQQRVAIARTLAMSPDIVLFDEVTSALDPERAREVFESVHRLAEEDGMTMVLVTHDMEFAYGEIPDEVIYMEGGRIRFQGPRRQALASELIPEVFKDR